MSLRLSSRSSGIKEAIRALERWRNKDIPDAMRGGIEESMYSAQEMMQQYPPESEANQPPYPYWSRGVGRVYANGTVNPQSEHYGESWLLEIRQGSDMVEGRLANTASYAPWLGARQTQSWFHRMRGWPVIEDVADKLGLTVSKIAVSSAFAKKIRVAIDVLQEKLQR